MANYTKRKADGKKYVGSTRWSEGDYEPGRGMLSKREIKAILAAYNAGEMTVFEIAERFCVSDGTVARLVRQYGTPSRLKKFTLAYEKALEATRMWHDSSTSRQHIANFLGISVNHIRRCLEARGCSLEDKRIVNKKPPKPPSVWKEQRTVRAKEKLQAWAEARRLGMTWSEISPGRARRAMQHFCAMKKLHPDWFNG